MVFLALHPDLIIFAHMETIPKTDCLEVGFFRKTHGVHGELVLEFDPRFESSVEDANRFFVELEGLLVPFFLVEDGFRFKTNNSAILTFDDVETEKYAKRLVGQKVFLFLNQIIDNPEVVNSSQFIDFLLIDEIIGEIGIIKQIDNYSGNIVITVDYRGDELLVPFNDDFLIFVDEQNKILKLNLPEGLIEL